VKLHNQTCSNNYYSYNKFSGDEDPNIVVKGVKVVSEDEDGYNDGDDGVVDDDRDSESTQSDLLKLHMVMSFPALFPI
jgi:hypothetical protein